MEKIWYNVKNQIILTLRDFKRARGLSMLHNSQSRSFIRIGILFAAFVLLPLVVLATFSWYAVATAEEQRRQTISDDLERRFFGFLHQTSPAIFCRTHLNALLGASESRKTSESSLLKLLKGSRRRWAFNFDPYFFSPDGKLITPPSISVLHRFALKNLWKNLSDSSANPQKLSGKDRKIFEALFGAEFSISTWRKREGDLLDIRYQGKDGFLLWKRWAGENRGGAIIVVRELPDRQSLFAALSKPLAKKGFFLFAPEQGKISPWFGAIPAKNLRSHIGSLGVMKQSEIFEDSLVLRSWEIDGSPMILGRQISSWPFSWYRRLLILFVFMLFAVSAIFFRQASTGTKQKSLTIRFKLMFVFLFSLAIPAAGVAFLGFRLLADREKVLEGTAVLKVKEELNALDAGFLGEQKRFQDLCRSLRDRIASNWEPVSIERLLRGLKKEDRILIFQVRDLMGNLFFNRGEQTEVEGAEYFFDVFGKCAIHQSLASRLQSPEGKGFRPPEAKVSEMVQSAELGFGTLFSGKSLIHPIVLGRNIYFWYWDSFPKPESPPAVMTILQSFSSLEKSFLTLQLAKSLSSRSNEVFRFALSRDGDIVYPKGFQVGTGILAQFEILSRWGRPVQSSLRYRGRNYLLVGQRGKYLADFSLFALIPKESILQSVKYLRYGIFLCLAMSVAVALFIGTMLTNQFVSPIHDLHDGMLALQRRDVNFRVPLTFSDELGELAQTFNLMIEDLREMELAKIVQNSLIPHALPELPGYRISLETLVATDLGGDYSDILPLDNERFLLVIGDVSGHGVSAALGMTIAKAITYQFSLEERPLANLFHRLNRIVFNALKAKLLLHFIGAVLTPKTGHVQLINAAHAFPLVIRQDGTLLEIDKVSQPLGSQAIGLAFHSEEFVLHAGETLFFYTDGIIEGMNQNKEWFGKQRVRTILRKKPWENPKELSRELLDEFFAFRKTPELDDDITLFTLTRGKSQT